MDVKSPKPKQTLVPQEACEDQRVQALHLFNVYYWSLAANCNRQRGSCVQTAGSFSYSNSTSVKQNPEAKPLQSTRQESEDGWWLAIKAWSCYYLGQWLEGRSRKNEKFSTLGKLLAASYSKNRNPPRGKLQVTFLLSPLSLIWKMILSSCLQSQIVTY